MRLWHKFTVGIAILAGLFLFWLSLAYGELPRLWSAHEHRRIGARDAIVSYTSQDIPGDPINLMVSGSEDAIACAFRRAGWVKADPISLRSSAGIVASVLLDREYPAAPVSPLYVQDRRQRLAFERDEGRTARKRHHVRWWRVGGDRWLGAATFDRGVGLNLYTLQVTHHIGPDVDAERARAGAVLERIGARYAGSLPSRLAPDRTHRNGGGDRYRTDGRITAYVLPPLAC